MKGPISWMTRNTVAANLLMVFILLVGVVAASNIVQEVFPETTLDAIRITTPYLGASPEEVEEGIVRKIEEQIESVEGIRRITSVAAENVGFVTAELELGADAAKALDDIKAEIDRITTFPEEAEEPEIAELTSRRQVIQLAIHGNVSERSLKELANQIKDDLSSTDGISYVQVNSVREYEIAIEVSMETMRAYGLTLSDISMAVRRGSLDLPGGSIETRDEEILIRTKGQNYSAADFREIIVVGRSDGTIVRLADIADVRDGFEEADLITRFDGEPTSFVEVYRTSDERVLDIVELVYAYVETLSVPEGISIDVWRDEAKLFNSRYDLMLKNGMMGLFLVILALGLFLNSRLAFWVSIGILISFTGTFAIMVYLGVSLNMISLVAFILALGIVVDDAIVIGENVFAEQEKGLDPVEAAEKGATRLARPVIFAVLTTMAAFAPLLFVPGVMGKLMENLPMVVLAVLALSLVESLFILPAHLSHYSALRGDKKKNPILERIEKVQAAVARGVEWNINGPLDKTLRFCTRHYGLVIVSGISAILLAAGLIAGGFVRFTFMPEVEGENVIAHLEMPAGTPAARTEAVAAFLEQKGREVQQALQAELPDDHPPIVKHVFSSIGSQPSSNVVMRGLGGPDLIDASKAEVNFELLAAEERELSSARFEEAWREAVGTIPGVKTLQFQSAMFTLGAPIELEISAPDNDVLDRSLAALKEALVGFTGVYEVEDDREQGKREVKLKLKPQARTLGITLDELARQVRAAYYGDEALRIQRGRDDIRVMVRLPKGERDALADMDDLRIRTQQGAHIPFSEVATAEFGYGPASINRRDRRPVVTVTAEVNADIVQPGDVIAELEETVLPALARDYPGFRASFEGEQREQADALDALKRGFIIALFVIYALLAIPFKSYTQPLIIMAVIPFGIIGALIGHLVMGMAMGLLSLFGVIGLSGVVVNDSLVLIDYINQERANGASVADAVVTSGKVRFRAILLTSLTTFLGVLPLILEKSLQAQFLIPIAVSLGFGILFATMLVLILVPSLVMLEARLRELLGRSGSYESTT